VNVPGGPGKLPLAIRNMALACMALSALVGFFSLTELLALLQPADPARLPLQLPGTFGNEAFRKGIEAQRAAVEAMRVPRVLTLSALGMACALNFVAASRLIWPRGLRRESMRRLVVGSSVAVALLRTLDGAQLTVVARRVGGAMARAADSIPGLTQLTPVEAEGAVLSLVVSVAVLQTAVLVGAFAFVSHYFRTPRARQVFEALDNPR